jgi:transposase InsO family protein
VARGVAQLVRTGTDLSPANPVWILCATSSSLSRLRASYIEDRFHSAGIQAVKIPPRAPKANAYAERWVRSVRTECLDWTLIWNRHHLQRVLTRYLEHYNTGRPHRGIDLDLPMPPPVATVTALPVKPVERIDTFRVGGL